MIKYLIKFVQREEHADMLISGKLFMRPVKYYHNLELGQGDKSEAGILDGIAIYKDTTIPIYCLYSVEQDEIVNGIITINKQLIDDFKCENGYLVVIKYDDFEKCLYTVETNGYELNAGKVTYAYRTMDTLEMLINDKTGKSLFIKHPYFSRQKEYRIAVAKKVYGINEKPIDSVIYNFATDLKDITTKLSISSLKSVGDNYCINESKLNFKTK
jgi:hypothetical protein